jgi:hypothetical protein
MLFWIFADTFFKSIIFFLVFPFVDNDIELWATFIMVGVWTVLRLIFSITNGHEDVFGLVKAITTFIQNFILADQCIHFPYRASHGWSFWNFYRLSYFWFIDNAANIIVSWINSLNIKFFQRDQRVWSCSGFVIAKAQLPMGIFAPNPRLLLWCDCVIVFVSKNQVDKGRW